MTIEARCRVFYLGHQCKLPDKHDGKCVFREWQGSHTHLWPGTPDAKILPEPKHTPPMPDVPQPPIAWLAERDDGDNQLFFDKEDARRASAFIRPLYAHPHYSDRGYAALGIGQYVINHSAAGYPPELIISRATEEEKRDREVGESRDNPPDAVLRAEDMLIRIAFTSERGLSALEEQLAWVRKVHFSTLESDLNKLTKDFGAGIADAIKPPGPPLFFCKMPKDTLVKEDIDTRINKRAVKDRIAELVAECIAAGREEAENEIKKLRADLRTILEAADNVREWTSGFEERAPVLRAYDLARSKVKKP